MLLNALIQCLLRKMIIFIPALEVSVPPLKIKHSAQRNETHLEADALEQAQCNQHCINCDILHLLLRD